MMMTEGMCCIADPFLNDETFFLSVLTLEELGATGAKGLVGVTSNPVIATGLAGLAAAANAQAAVEVSQNSQAHDILLSKCSWLQIP